MTLQNSDHKKHKAFSNPLRLRMMGFLDEPLTVKQVAQKMEMRPHTLYHHIRVLEGCGIVELVKHEKLRGSIEKKYYQLTTEYRNQSQRAAVEPNEIVCFARAIIDEYQKSNIARPDLPAQVHKSLVTVRSEDAEEIQKKLNEGLEELVENYLKPFDTPDGDITFIFNTFGFLR